jgi:hypothetical protein
MLDPPFHVFRITLVIAHCNRMFRLRASGIAEICDVKQAWLDAPRVGRAAARMLYISMQTPLLSVLQLRSPSLRYLQDFLF